MSSSILFLWWKEVFEDATPFDLVEELHVQQKLPVAMRQFAVLLEEEAKNLVAADEAGAHEEPRKAMSIFNCVGKHLQSHWEDNLCMTEWATVSRESGLRDNVMIQNLQDACLKVLVAARARARASSEHAVEKDNKVIVTNAVQPAKKESTSTANPADIV